MRLDPQLQPILEMIGGELPVVGRTAAEVRAVMSGGAPRRDVGLRAVEDLTVMGADGSLPARVYRPDGTASPAPDWVASTSPINVLMTVMISALDPGRSRSPMGDSEAAASAP